MSRVSGADGAEYYLGVDPSITNTGVVLLDAAGRLVAFADGKDFVARGCRGFERYMEQARGIEKFVADNVETGSEVHCGYEGYSYGSEHRAFDLAEYGGVLKNALLNRNVTPIYVVPPTVNKAFGVGNGSATKRMMMERAAAEEPALEGASDDVCDAYFLARFAMAVDGLIDAEEGDLLRSRAAAVRRWKDGEKNELRGRDG